MSDNTSDRKKEIKGRHQKSLLIQLSIVALFACFLWLSTKKDKPVRIEHNIIPGASTIPLKKLPTIDLLLAKKNILKLSEKQIKQLSELKVKQDRKLTPIDRQLERAVDDFNTFMNSKGKNRTNMSEIVSHSSPATELGKRRRVIVQGFSEEGMKVLDTKQSNLASQIYFKKDMKSKSFQENGEVNDKL